MAVGLRLRIRSSLDVSRGLEAHGQEANAGHITKGLLGNFNRSLKLFFWPFVIVHTTSHLCNLENLLCCSIFMSNAIRAVHKQSKCGSTW